MNENRDGKSPETAFVVRSTGEYTPEMRAIVNRVYGGNDDSYFVLSETTLEHRKGGKRYKVLFLEDKDSIKHTVYFEIG